MGDTTNILAETGLGGTINFLLLIVLGVALIKLIDGYKKGIIKEIISLVSLLVLCAVVALVAGGISCYQDKKILHVVVAFLLLGVLGVVHHLLGVVFFSAKMISKLPVVHFADKLLGAVFGVLEVLLVLWTIDTLVAMMDLGAFKTMYLSYTSDSELLTWFFEHNYLRYFVEQLIPDVDLRSLSELLEMYKNNL
ncbi:MAG: CvpA family protein [Acetatifactor sp.]